MVDLTKVETPAGFDDCRIDSSINVVKVEPAGKLE
jgi:hypothetical protein